MHEEETETFNIDWLRQLRKDTLHFQTPILGGHIWLDESLLFSLDKISLAEIYISFLPCHW